MSALDLGGATPCPGCGEVICGRVELGPETVDAIARRVAELLAPRPAEATPDARGLVDAAVLARRLQVTPTWVREHAEELGVVRIGEGPRPRLRFDVERAMQAYAERDAVEERHRAPEPARRAVSSSGRRRRSPARSSAQTVAVPAWEE